MNIEARKLVIGCYQVKSHKETKTKDKKQYTIILSDDDEPELTTL